VVFLYPFFRKCATSHGKEEAMRYYVCYLPDGHELDFGKKCTDVAYDNTVFKAVDSDGVCLGIIPIINVSAFVLKEA